MHLFLGRGQAAGWGILAHSEGLFDAEGHVAGQGALLLSRLDRAGRETLRAAAAAVTVSPAGSMISVRMKSPGWGGLFTGFSSSLGTFACLGEWGKLSGAGA